MARTDLAPAAVAAYVQSMIAWRPSGALLNDVCLANTHIGSQFTTLSLKGMLPVGFFSSSSPSGREYLNVSCQRPSLSGSYSYQYGLPSIEDASMVTSCPPSGSPPQFRHRMVLRLLIQ
ncbi:hypothetical protein AcV7_005074 [Taiwanofungus camphoratus]|nr:hypothetical protein AcV7_005074 [Antrodia cinnamomea]